MKTKIIPFDLETAKKIQAGEIEDIIKTKYGEDVRIVCWDRRDSYTGPIIALYTTDKENETPLYCNVNGKEAFTGKDIVLEVPDNEPQFKPFDKVLVRGRYNKRNNDTYWYPSLFERIIESSFGDDKGTIYYKVLTNIELWRECIPYEGNEQLVGTTDKPKEE